MTPSDEAERLARELAEAEHPKTKVEYPAWVGEEYTRGVQLVSDAIALGWQLRAIKAFTPILTPLCEENARLREENEGLRKAASRVCYAHELQPSHDNRELENKHIRMTHADSIAELRAALQPKPEKTNES